MIHGENKKFSLDHELSQKREIESWGNKRKSSILERIEKVNLMDLQTHLVFSIKLKRGNTRMLIFSTIKLHVPPVMDRKFFKDCCNFMKI